MKSLIKTVLLLLLPVAAIGQDSVITITPGMFDKESHQMYLAATDGWVFKSGTGASWHQKDIDVTGWKKFKPSELSVKDIDKNGRVEGWFRIKIKLSDSLGMEPMGVKLSTWAASELYINGKLVTKAGNTGADGKPFKEYYPFGNLSYPAGLVPGNEYTFALHFVDYLSPIPPVHLKSENTGLNLLIRITDPNYNKAFLKNAQDQDVFPMIWISVCTTLCLLFWLLYLQNPLEKNLRLIAFGSTVLALAMFFNGQNDAKTFLVNEIFKIATSLFIMLGCCFMLLILVNIFKRKTTRALKAFLLVFIIGWTISQFLMLQFSNVITLILMVVLFGICMYYIISSWKTLKGAQWTIVVGMLISIVSGLLFTLGTVLGIVFTVFAENLLVTCYSLSLPLSLLLYISMRFKEIIKEVRQNAEQVVQLSEEKKQQALNQQKILEEEVERQTADLKNTLINLKSTQTQLVQSEKMASLGELTAGIAHEIQNPLNFVNNFSEVSNELIKEIEEEREKKKEDRDEELIGEILGNISQNLEKINHHGKRADSIVKGMLQHSRSSTAVKEPTDINKLADEYLRLAYHGLRAKDKSFNATMKTDYDETISSINIVPQDLGRVILNLITNAFYAVDVKKKSGIQNYEPTIIVSTKNVGDSVEIAVQDNGNGIPQKVLDKIFQPFFTTKPTGQGTGLGLSLAYDIVKSHSGEVKVETKEGEETKFIITLPV